MAGAMVCITMLPSTNNCKSALNVEFLIESPLSHTVEVLSRTIGMVQRSVFAAREGGQPVVGSTECTALGAFDMTLPFAVNLIFPLISSFSDGADVPIPTPYPVTAITELPVPPPFGENEM